MTREVRVVTSKGKFQQTVSVGGHRLIADEPAESGGDDTGPTPHELVLAGLGACTSMTLKVYADRKGWSLRSADVHLYGERDAAGTYVIRRTVALEGDLDDEQRRKLLEIAGKCPVHKTLTGEIRIESSLDNP